MVVRSSLKQPVRNLAPLLAGGTTSEVSTRGADIVAWSDRTALVMAATGRPLLPPGVERLPALSLQEVVELLRCLLATVVDLIVSNAIHVSKTLTIVAASPLVLPCITCVHLCVVVVVVAPWLVAA